MMIVASVPLTVRTPSGSIDLQPGQPVNLEEADALKLLAKAKGKVQMVSSPDSITEIFWENSGTGEIRGPAFLLDRLTIQEGDRLEEWLLVELQGAMYWIQLFALRSRHQWRFQRPIKTATPITPDTPSEAR